MVAAIHPLLTLMGEAAVQALRPFLLLMAPGWEGLRGLHRALEGRRCTRRQGLGSQSHSLPPALSLLLPTYQEGTYLTPDSVKCLMVTSTAPLAVLVDPVYRRLDPYLLPWGLL